MVRRISWIVPLPDMVKCIMKLLAIVVLEDHLLVFFGRLDRFAGWDILNVVPGHEDCRWVRVAVELELFALVRVEHLHSQKSQKVVHVDLHEATVQRHLRFFKALAFWDDVRDRKVGRDEDRCLGELRRLVLLVDWEPALIADGLQKLDAQLLHIRVIEVFKHDMRVTFVVVEVKEPVVEILLVRFRGRARPRS